MIEINLLPESVKPKHAVRFEIPSLPIIPIAAGCAGLLVLFYLGILGVSAMRAGQLTRLERLWQEKEPGHRGYLDLKKRLDGLRERKRLAQEVSTKNFLCSQKMALICGHIPEDIRLTHLSLKGDKSLLSLQLEGTTSSQKGKSAIDSISRLVQAINGDETLMRGLARVELGPIERVPQGAEGIIKFTLNSQAAGG